MSGWFVGSGQCTLRGGKGNCEGCPSKAWPWRVSYKRATASCARDTFLPWEAVTKEAAVAAPAATGVTREWGASCSIPEATPFSGRRVVLVRRLLLCDGLCMWARCAARSIVMLSVLRPRPRAGASLTWVSAMPSAGAPPARPACSVGALPGRYRREATKYRGTSCNQVSRPNFQFWAPPSSPIPCAILRIVGSGQVASGRRELHGVGFSYAREETQVTSGALDHEDEDREKCPLQPR